MTAELEFSPLEEMVNNFPLYDGGRISTTGQHNTAMCIYRMHQIAGIGKGKAPSYCERIIKLLIDKIEELADIKEEDLPEKCKQQLYWMIEEGYDFTTNKDTLLYEVATYQVTEKAISFGIRWIFDFAKRRDIPLPKGEWTAMKAHEIPQLSRRKTRWGGEYLDEDRIDDAFLYEGTKIHFMDGEKLLRLCGDFASELLNTVKKELEEWKEIELENS